MILKFFKNLFKKETPPKDVMYVNYKEYEIRVTLDEEGLPYLIEPPVGVDLSKDDIIDIIKLVGKTLENKYLLGFDK